MVEDGDLDVPMRLELGITVQTNLPYVPREWEKPVEDAQFRVPRMGQLWMQSDCGPDPVSPVRQLRSFFPCGRRRRNRQDIDTTLLAGGDDLGGVTIEVEVAVQVNHTTRTALRNRLNSSIPRFTTSRYGVTSSISFEHSEAPSQRSRPSLRIWVYTHGGRSNIVEPGVVRVVARQVRIPIRGPVLASPRVKAGSPDEARDTAATMLVGIAREAPATRGRVGECFEKRLIITVA